MKIATPSIMKILTLMMLSGFRHCIVGTLILLLAPVFAFGQFGQKNEIGNVLFKADLYSIKADRGLVPKFMHGIYYNRNFGNWTWTSSISGGQNAKHEPCRDCDSGEDESSQYIQDFSIASGFNYNIRFGATKKWGVIMGSQLAFQYYDYSYYPGYQLESQGIIETYEDHKLGAFKQTVGLSYQPNKVLKISILSSGTIGYGTVYDQNSKCGDPTMFATAASFSAAEFRIGICF
ncbi:hypothetical protein JYT72_00720 [Crocinitomix catalasitica]|nr:hypothetical protein [Crocinitomix catalasitica]